MRKKGFKLQFEKINILDALVILALTIGLIMAIFYTQNELSIGIVGALAGYLGGAAKNNIHKEGEVK